MACRRRTRRSRSRRRKCHRTGRMTRNPFLNFLRCYRKRHCGLSAIQIACKGAMAWRKMSASEKAPYIRAARCAPKRSSCRRKSRRRRRRRRRSRSRCGC